MVHLVKFANSCIAKQKSVRSRNRILLPLFSSIFTISLYGMLFLPKVTAEFQGHR